MGLLENIDNFLGTRIGLLVNDPKTALNKINQDAGLFNQASLLATQAERNSMRGLPITTEQAAAMQYVNKKTEDLAMGFAGSTKLPTKVFHGGPSRVVTPDLSKSGITSGLKEEGKAFWVTPSESSAAGFGKLTSKNPIISEFNFTPKNPLVIEYPIKSIFDGSFEQIKINALNNARKLGNDSVVFKQAGQGTKLIDDEIAIIDINSLKSNFTKK